MLSQTLKALVFSSCLSGCISEPERINDPFTWTVPVNSFQLNFDGLCANGQSFFVVGGSTENGAMLRWQPQSWDRPDVPLVGRLRACYGWGTSMIAVGDQGSAISKRIETWRSEDFPEEFGTFDLVDVWGSDALQIAVGHDTEAERPVAIMREAEGDWRTVDASQIQSRFRGVWGLSRQSLWAVGESGLIAKLEGDVFVPVASPTSEPLLDIWGSSVDELYAVGGDEVGVALQWNGLEWFVKAELDTPLNSVWTSSNRHLVMAGQQQVTRIDRPFGTTVGQAATSARFEDYEILSVVGYGASANVALARNVETRINAVLSHGNSVGGGIVKPADDL